MKLWAMGRVLLGSAMVLLAASSWAQREATPPRPNFVLIVVDDAGFSDLSYFYRVFRRRYGASPSDVRAQVRRDH